MSETVLLVALLAVAVQGLVTWTATDAARRDRDHARADRARAAFFAAVRCACPGCCADAVDGRRPRHAVETRKELPR